MGMGSWTRIAVKLPSGTSMARRRFFLAASGLSSSGLPQATA